MSKVKPFLYMLGKGGISVLQTAIFNFCEMKKNRCQILCFMCICWLRQYNNLQLRCNIDVKHAEISRSVTTHATSQEVSPRLYNTKPNPDIK